jgi:putative transposase
VLFRYRGESYLLHEFVLMPDHFHLLISPLESLERAVQLIKGGFSRRASLELQTKWTIWQRGFSDHRIRDFQDYELHRGYIYRNPVKARLCESAAAYRYGSANGQFGLDPCPQGLKPLLLTSVDDTAEAVPLQSKSSMVGHENGSNPQRLKPLLLTSVDGTAEAVPLQSKSSRVGHENGPNPQGLKPLLAGAGDGRAKDPPKQAQGADRGWQGAVEAVPLQNIRR